MTIEVMCRIADGPLTPAELKVSQSAVPLVAWSVDIPNVSQARDLQGKDLTIELHFPDNTVWTGEAYSVADIGPHHQASGQPLQLRGIGPLSENSIPVHSDVVIKRINAMSAEHQS